MSRSTNDRSKILLNPVLGSLADRRRRELLGILLDCASPVAERELAMRLIAEEQGASATEVTHEAAQSVRTDLRHVHLPALEDANLVEWDRDEATVTTTDHPALQDPNLQRIIETEASGWDAVVATLADTRRRTVLSVLADRDGPLSRNDLARDVVARGTDRNQLGGEWVQPGGEWDLPGEEEGQPDEKEVLVSLAHVHLPKLADAGLVEYDSQAGTATYVGHPELEEEWLAVAADDPPRPILPGAHHSSGIWTIEGRGDVLEQGRSLVDRAEDELFVMVTTDGLLEEKCISAFQRAIERDVDVYVGAQSSAVRELVRERVPEAVIWEPQLDWLDFPPEREKIGRLVFTDREAIMIATFGEMTDAGARAETAITGSGETNALVVLMRELLGSRLDHLDAHSEDVRSQLPL